MEFVSRFPTGMKNGRSNGESEHKAEVYDLQVVKRVKLESTAFSFNEWC